MYKIRPSGAFVTGLEIGPFSRPDSGLRLRYHVYAVHLIPCFAWEFLAVWL